MAFFYFNNTEDLDFNDLIVKPTKEPWQLKHMMTYNLNASFCEDGKVGTDSDADGLCDRDEAKYGFDPQKRFSVDFLDIEGIQMDVSGYGDFFQRRFVIFEEVPRECSDRSDEDFDMLTYCEEKYIINQRPSGTIDDRIDGDELNSDTDLDGFLDGLEIFSFNDKGSAMDNRNVGLTYDGEEENSGTQLVQHRNPKIFDPNAFRYDMDLQPMGVVNGSTCYQMTQSHLQLMPTLAVKEEDTLPGLGHEALGNVVYMYYIQTPQSDPMGTGVLKYSFQTLKADAQHADTFKTGVGLKIRSDVFESYIIPTN